MAHQREVNVLLAYHHRPSNDTKRRAEKKTLRQTLRVQVPNNHILAQDLYYNYYDPHPKYLIIRYLDL